jgi:predicted nucleic acid-binding protein
MILIVADTGPINYLIQIGEIEILPRMVEKVILPSPVQTELLHASAPAAVRTWAAQPPSWIEVRSATQKIEERDISATDREAIALAMELNASILLMDDSQARRCACRLGKWGDHEGENRGSRHGASPETSISPLVKHALLPVTL